MKLPNWVKIAWWVVLTGLLTAFLYMRLDDLMLGMGTLPDVVAFVIWIALVLAPIFSEVSLLGVTLKQQLDDLKQTVTNQLIDMRNEVRSEVKTTISPQLYFPPAPTDAQLPKIEEMIKREIANATSLLRDSGPQVADPSPEQILEMDPNVEFLFATRYKIESEMRRIAADVGLELPDRPIPAFALSRKLSEAEVIEPGLHHAVREVYAVCSPAIHGEPITDAQVQFVRDVAPKLLTALRSIPNGKIAHRVATRPHEIKDARRV